MHQIIVLAAHEVEEIGSIYINDEIVTVSGSNFVTGSIWNSKIRIEKFDGSQTAAPANLLSESELTGANALTSAFVGNGIAYLYVRYEYDAEVFASGLPLVTAIVKGKKVYDPRTSSTVYSNNAALCVRDFIKSTYGLNDSAIDDVSFAAAANESDENVALSGSGTEKRYTINGIVKASSPIGKVLGDMSTACAGTLFWGSGYWKLKVGAYSAPVKTLTLDDLRGPINLQTRTSTRDSFNGVTGTFNNASGDFITSDYPPIISSAFKTEDGGDELLLDLPLPFTTNAPAAQRIAKMTLYRGREQMAINADFGLEAFNVEVGDTIAFTNERYGFDEKEFEVIGWRFSPNQQAGDLRVNLTLQETSSDAFDWSAEEQALLANNTNLPDFNNVAVPTSLALAAQSVINGDGSASGSISASWTASVDSFVSYYEVQSKISTDTEYTGTTTTSTKHLISGTISSLVYNVRIRGVSGIGKKSAWVSSSVTSVADTTAPAAPTSVSASPGFRQNIVNWTNASALDLSFVQVFASASNNSSGASIVGSTKGTEFVHAGLAQSTLRYYWVKSVDTSGNVSGFSSVISATTLADPQNGTDGTDGTDGTNGTNGATGNTVVTGKVYYQTLQGSAPSTPSATSYNVSSAAFVGLTSGWSLTQPSVDITDTSIQEWSSNFTVTIDGVSSAQTLVFTTASGAIQVTADIESDNYVSGSAGWKIERDTGNAEFQNATIRGTLNATDITAGTLEADHIKLTGSQLQNSGGSLIISGGGVDTAQIAANAVSASNRFVTATGVGSNASPYGAQIASHSVSATIGDKLYISTEIAYFNLANWTANSNFFSMFTFLNGATFSLTALHFPNMTNYYGGLHYAGIFTAVATGTLSLTVNLYTNVSTANSIQAVNFKVNVLKLER